MTIQTIITPFYLDKKLANQEIQEKGLTVGRLSTMFSAFSPLNREIVLLLLNSITTKTTKQIVRYINTKEIISFINEFSTEELENKFLITYARLFERIYEEATGHSPKEELKQ